MAKAEKVYEFLGSRNLSSSPISIDNLEGNKYDYELVAFFDVEGLASDFQGTINNDAGSNYRRYYMQGDGSSATANINDSLSSFNPGSRSFSYPTLTTMSFKGSSSNERHISCSNSFSSTAGDTRVRAIDFYWKNTLDEITSIQLTKSVSVTSNCHIILYRIPKPTSQQHWEKIGELNWAAESTTKSFTGLNGDQDEQYRLVWDGDALLTTQINNDGGSNYIRQVLVNGNGSIAAANSTVTSLDPGGAQSEIIINAETGSKRLCIATASNIVSQQQRERSYWYSDTVTNVVSLDCTPSASSSGKSILYRKASKNKSGVLPWELVQSVELNGVDFSAGHTFSGLQGDSTTLYRLEWLGDNSDALQVQINADASNIYDEQYLRGNNANATASANTNTASTNFVDLQTASTQATSNMYIYPRTGSSRPMLHHQACREGRIKFLAGWYGESITEWTSLKVFGSTSNSITGTLKLWRLK